MTQAANRDMGRVIMVDNDPSIRKALGNLMESVGLDFHAFAAPAELDDFAWPDCPACLILDVRMPGSNGLDFHEEFRKTHPEMPVIFITGHGDVAMSVRAMKAGAIEFLTKPFREQDLLDAIHTGLARSRAERDQAQLRRDLQARLAALTRREHEVMDLIVAGQLTKQIAARLGLSEITVKVCRATLMKKIGATSLVELGIMAERLARAPPS